VTRIYKQGELAVDFDNREWSTALVSSTNWCLPRRRRSISARARSTRPWSPADDRALSDAAAHLVYTGVTRGKRLGVLARRWLLRSREVGCGGGGRS
jgi:hypothetical protein